MKVSVILPTYNRANSLVNAIESVLHQSYDNLELIVVDDASSDNTREIVTAIEDVRIKYLHRRINGGASAARNTGLATAKGEFIAFQDSDDLWLPQKLERQIRLFETLPEDVGVVTGSKILYGRDEARNYGPGKVTLSPAPSGCLSLDEDQLKRFFSGNRISLQNALFRKNCFPSITWFDPCAKANADWEFNVRLVQHTRVYEDIVPVVLAFISSDSISKNTRKKALGLIRIIKKNRKQLANYNDVYARRLVQLGQMMRKMGKGRLAVRFIVAGLAKDPRVAFYIVKSGKNYLFRKTYSFWTQYKYHG